MEGPEDKPGIMYKFCTDLFAYAEKMEKLDFDIKASYLEIYNNNITDLLAKKTKECKIMEDKIRGIYVTNIAQFPVSSFDDIKKILQIGTKNRTVAETKMNKFSSRSHGILTLYVEQKEKDDAEGFTLKQSKIHLIDLAGSERQKDTLAKGDRLREGAGINQSLSCLGNVINALVSKKPHIPYRDSKLTRLLQDSIGGTACTLMCSCLSPASINYEESLSTLMFADRAKQIKNVIRISRDPKLAKIAELLEENRKLKERILQLEMELNKCGKRIGGDSVGTAKCQCCIML